MTDYYNETDTNLNLIPTDDHYCLNEFEAKKIDNRKSIAFNRCYGIKNMFLEIWYQGKDGLEDYCDEWTNTKVNFCPFCGLKSEIIESDEFKGFYPKLPFFQLIKDPVVLESDVEMMIKELSLRNTISELGKTNEKE